MLSIHKLLGIAFVVILKKGGAYTIFPETCILFVPVITFSPFLLCK